uniref:Uncharacterized protein n=1 Tax=Anopheles culicifacies TaxID=139723 RepID=A0A182LUC7_9DIPT
MFSHCSESCESIRPRYTDPAVLITARMPRSPAFRWAPIDSAASRSTSSRVTSIFIGTTDPLTGVSEFSRIFIQPRSSLAGSDSTGSFIPANTRCPLLAKNYRCASVRNSAIQASITFRISLGVISGSVLFDFGWKHMTRQVPFAGAIWNSGSSLAGGSGTCSNRAGKSFVNTNVDS